MSISLNQYNPPEHLAPYLEFFWLGEFNTNSFELFSQRVIPNGYVELIIHLTDDHCELADGESFSSSPDYTLIGVYTKPYDVQFKQLVKVFGIRFKPEGIYHIFGIPASEVQEGFADAESFTGRSFKEFCGRLRESKTHSQMIQISCHYLHQNISRSKTELYYLNHAAELIRRRNGLISIDELAGEICISTRQLEREFKTKIGISPKSYMRIARLNEVNRIIKSGALTDLTSLSHYCGYSDQAHFIRDFKYFTGKSPKAFLKTIDKFIINPESGSSAEE